MRNKDKMSDEAWSTSPPNRAAADRLCLWRLCKHKTCVRAQACSGDPRACASVLRLWLGELAARGAPDDAPRLLTKEEARLFALFRSAVEQADVKPAAPEDAAEAERFREELVRRLRAINETGTAGTEDAAAA